MIDVKMWKLKIRNIVLGFKVWRCNHFELKTGKAVAKARRMNNKLQYMTDDASNYLNRMIYDFDNLL